MAKAICTTTTTTMHGNRASGFANLLRNNSDDINRRRATAKLTCRRGASTGYLLLHVLTAKVWR